MSAKVLETITLHCGSSKTGTTALQESLYAASETLTEHGLLYPHLTDRSNHSELFLLDAQDNEILEAFGRHTSEGLAESRRKSQELWTLLESQIETTRTRHLILSSEYLFELDAESLNAIIARLKRLSDHVRGILYLRDPVSFYASSAQQVVKFGARLPNPEASFNYRDRVERLSRTMQGRLVVRRFDPEHLQNANIVTDFLSQITPEPEEIRKRIPKIMSNVSLSGEAMVLLQEFNREVWVDRRISGNPQDMTLIKHLSRVEANGKYSRPRIQHSVREKILSANAADLSWLKNEYTIDFPNPPSSEQEEIASGSSETLPAMDRVESVFEVDRKLVEVLRGQTLLSLVNSEITLESSRESLRVALDAANANANALKKSKEAMRVALDNANAAAKAANIKVSTLDRMNQRLTKELDRLGRKKRRARSISYILALPYVLLTFPISVPMLLYFMHRRKAKKIGAKARRSSRSLIATRPAAVTPVAAITNEVTAPILLWCPISVSGLTTQLGQLTAILRKAGVNYNISYHVKPTIEHPEKEHWIDPKQINRPKVVFYMERYVPFDLGFEESFHVFYVNLDWLKQEAISTARAYADLVLCPVRHRFHELQETFSNAKVTLLPWPPAVKVEAAVVNERNAIATGERPIRVLYVGNDYDEKSRKSPYATIEAILSCERRDLIFDLKFRSRLPEQVKNNLLSRPNVDTVMDRQASPAEIEELYLRADVNLIPNESEGNGLSIIESLAKGVVPAVLDGYPMKDVVSEETGYLIPCTEDGVKEYAAVYRTSADAILRFLDELSVKGVELRRAAILASQDELKQRQTELETVVHGVLASAGLMAEKASNGLLDSEGPDFSTDGRIEPSELKTLLARPAFNVYREPRLIDVHITTSRRAPVFRPTLQRLLETIDASPFEHRLFLSADNPDVQTRRVIDQFEDRFEDVLITGSQMGLPYLWNSILDRSRSTVARTEQRPDFICYIQDDCLIQRPETYFQEMVEAANLISPGHLGYVSGYYTTVHRGFSEMAIKTKRYVLSDSIDGKNFMARPKLLYSIGKLTWWFPDGMRRGNPGPIRGSHFDLWQWKESPNSLMKQKRINITIPGLCEHTAQTQDLSTWGNDTTEDAVADRLAMGKVYVTR